ncbi:hypothetical protein [Halorubellus sp. PRR65]|uniref:hypothetical protein n=1 Tax=Halorubellus sp. PRR65 TaxID=3098148 RepID=UPI002B25FFA6|nr:hypothetical protein [Halorubellus sp. PRR65]
MFKAPLWYLVLLGGTSVVTVVTMWRFHREEPTDLTRFVQLLHVGVLVWATMAFFENLGVSPMVSHTFTKLTYLAIPLVPTA